MQTQQTNRKYLIRVRKQYADVYTDADAIVRRIFNSLSEATANATAITLINTRKYYYFITSPLSRDDAYRIFSGWGSLPYVEVYPVISDTVYGYPYTHTFCVRTYPNRRTDRLPKVAHKLRDYRWVAYEKAGAVEGLLISEEPPVVPYPCELSTEAHIITCFADENIVRRTELTGCYPKSRISNSAETAQSGV
jgi:hypothetical protein